MVTTRSQSARNLRQRYKAYRRLSLLDTISDGGLISLIARQAFPMPPKPLLATIRGEHPSCTLTPYKQRPKVLRKNHCGCSAPTYFVCAICESRCCQRCAPTNKCEAKHGDEVVVVYVHSADGAVVPE